MTRSGRRWSLARASRDLGGVSAGRDRPWEGPHTTARFRWQGSSLWCYRPGPVDTSRTWPQCHQYELCLKRSTPITRLTHNLHGNTEWTLTSVFRKCTCGLSVRNLWIGIHCTLHSMKLFFLSISHSWYQFVYYWSAVFYFCIIIYRYFFLIIIIIIFIIIVLYYIIIVMTDC